MLVEMAVLCKTLEQQRKHSETKRHSLCTL